MKYTKCTLFKTALLLSFVLVSTYSFTQNYFPNTQLKQINQMAYNNSFEDLSINQKLDSTSSIASTINRHSKIIKNLYTPTSFAKSDTLFIGDIPSDSVYITGNYYYDGTIAIIGDGKLVFDECTGTITGDIVVYGDDAKLWVINSNLFFPQSFWYQRALIVAGNAELNISGSTLNYNGLPHDLVITGDAIVNQTDITNIGFTTCGVSANGTINIDNSNQAGEFVMTNNANANFSNSETVLVWHHIPETGVLDFSFPDGESISSYNFSDVETGVTGIDYSYSITNCTDVKWGLMPEPGSEMTISNSNIRTIGVWFKELPLFSVSGLINNSDYNDFSAPLSDHNIHLINTSVQTWSLYMFNNANGTVNSCIVGEIGTMSNSTCTAENCLIDGSGGYLFATDTSMMTSAFSYLNCNFQTSGNAYGIMAYGGQNMGRCIAFEKSIMFVLQANLVEQPEYHDDAMMWLLNIDNSTNLYIESVASIQGSAWIEKASDYYPNDFNWLLAEYQPNESDEWFECADTIFSEVFSGQICEWNTEGLAQGSYTLRLTMADNTVDENQVEVIKQIVLTDNPTNIKDNSLDNNIKVYPNPTTEIVYIEANNLIEVSAYSIDGRLIETFGKANKIDLSYLSSGVYFLNITTNQKEIIQRIVISEK